MKREDIDALLKTGVFPCDCKTPKLIETHISWVILCDEHVFKIKKPVQYSFLDFSTREKRKYYCQQEVVLNKRLVEGVYLGVVGIKPYQQRWVISKEAGDDNVQDYAVWMKRIEDRKRMDVMLLKGKVTPAHIQSVAHTLASFHDRADRHYTADSLAVQHDFEDIGLEKEFIRGRLGNGASRLVDDALKKSMHFLSGYDHVLKERTALGFVRDCHGDLHSRNIFLGRSPIIFDCIEFNPLIRRIDVLNELAFFCMDLEAFSHVHLSRAFITFYNDLHEVIRNMDDKKLFVYYKAYRANVRAKVNALRMKEAKNETTQKLQQDCIKYLQLMQDYMNCL